MSIGEGVIGAGEGVVVTSQEQGQIEQDRIFRGASSFKFNGFYSRNDLPKVKRETYTIDLEEYKSIATHWIALNVNGDNVGGVSNNATYFNSFRVEHIPKEIKKNHRQKTDHNKHFQNKSIQFNNVWILLH